MAKTNDDAAARMAAVAFLDRLIQACGPRIDDMDVPIDELGDLTIDDLAGDPGAVLREPGALARLMLLAARHRPAAQRARIDDVDVFNVRKWPTDPSALARVLDAFLREVTKLRQCVVATNRRPNQSPSDEGTTGAKRPRRKKGTESFALGVLAQHPEWTDAQIAEAAGVHRTSLYRMEVFMRARTTQKDDRTHRFQFDGHEFVLRGKGKGNSRHRRSR